MSLSSSLLIYLVILNSIVIHLALLTQPKNMSGQLSTQYTGKRKDVHIACMKSFISRLTEITNDPAFEKLNNALQGPFGSPKDSHYFNQTFEQIGHYISRTLDKISHLYTDEPYEEFKGTLYTMYRVTRSTQMLAEKVMKAHLVPNPTQRSYVREECERKILEEQLKELLFAVNSTLLSKLNNLFLHAPIPVSNLTIFSDLTATSLLSASFLLTCKQVIPAYNVSSIISKAEEMNKTITTVRNHFISTNIHNIVPNEIKNELKFIYAHACRPKESVIHLWKHLSDIYPSRAWVVFLNERDGTTPAHEAYNSMWFTVVGDHHTVLAHSLERRKNCSSDGHSIAGKSLKEHFLDRNEDFDTFARDDSNLLSSIDQLKTVLRPLPPREYLIAVFRYSSRRKVMRDPDNNYYYEHIEDPVTNRRTKTVLIGWC